MTRFISSILIGTLIRRLLWPLRKLIPFLILFLLLRFAFALEITVLNVGQGTSVLITAPTGQTALYDAGPNSGNATQSLQALGVQHLNLAIASHSHADHIGGMPDVLNTYKPGLFMDNGLPYTTQTYERTLQAALNAGSQLLEPVRRTITLGDNVTLTIAPPPGTNPNDQNNNSIGVRVDYGSFSAFLPGDAEAEQWAWWLRNHPDLFTPITMHLSSHHGSRNGDTQAAMNALQPDLVIISAGAGNTYGHPHTEALRLYQNASVYRTDQHGHVQVKASTDGTFAIHSPPMQNELVRVNAIQVHDITPSSTAQANAPPRPCVNINTAPQPELEQIMHIGPARATDIISARASRPFTTVDDLTRLNGIGPARLKDIHTQGVACTQ